VETPTQERSARTFEQAAMSGGEAAAVSLGVTQRLIGSLTELSIVAAKENGRLAAELQTAALDAARLAVGGVSLAPGVVGGAGPDALLPARARRDSRVGRARAYADGHQRAPGGTGRGPDAVGGHGDRAAHSRDVEQRHCADARGRPTLSARSGPASTPAGSGRFSRRSVDAGGESRWPARTRARAVARPTRPGDAPRSAVPPAGPRP
jgi:hypothetical protein